MKLFIDGVQQKETNENEIQTVVESVYAKERFIKEITINGQVERLDDVGQRQIHDEDIVELQTCTLDGLIEDSIASAFSVVPALYHKLTQIIDLIRIGDIAKGAQGFSEIVEAVQWNLQLLADLTSLHSGPSAVHELFHEGEHIVPILLDAWENEDYILLADILEFEALPWVSKWLEIIELFQAERKLEHVKQKMHILH